MSFFSDFQCRKANSRKHQAVNEEAKAGDENGRRPSIFPTKTPGKSGTIEGQIRSGPRNRDFLVPKSPDVCTAWLEHSRLGSPLFAMNTRRLVKPFSFHDSCS